MQPVSSVYRTTGVTPSRLQSETGASESDGSTATEVVGADRPTTTLSSILHRTPGPTPTGQSASSSASRASGRDASRAINDLATTMSLDTATVRQSIDDGSLSQLLAQNGVQSSLGMLFNTKL